MPLLSYCGGGVGSGSFARGRAAGLWSGAISMIELFVIDAVLRSSFSRVCGSDRGVLCL